jgi:hypothetical protein
MKFLIFHIIFIGWVLNSVNPEIEFSPKQLIREIQRFNANNQPSILEISDLNETMLDSLTGKFFKTTDTSPVEYFYIGRVLTCRAEGCSAQSERIKSGKSEYFDYFILFDATPAILSVEVFNYEATHGQEITVRGWLKQFNGYRADKELVAGRDVDAISGATTSVNSISSDIYDKTSLLKDYLQTPPK